MTLFINQILRPLVPAKQSSIFDYMMALRGEVFRDQEGRRTQRIILNNQSYFIKQHFGIGWQEILKNIIAMKQPVLSARNEWRALQKLQDLGIDVPEVLAYGVRNRVNLATMQSFILTKELSSTISLADFCSEWRLHPPHFTIKHAIIQKIAHIAQVLHENNMNHRDFYLCHFLLDIANGINNQSSNNIKIYLIDLHRAQIRRIRKNRWIIKDLSALYFSSKDFGLTKRDLFRFIKLYRNQSLATCLKKESGFWQKVIMRGEALYRKHSCK